MSILTKTVTSNSHEVQKIRLRRAYTYSHKKLLNKLQTMARQLPLTPLLTVSDFYNVRMSVAEPAEAPMLIHDPQECVLPVGELSHSAFGIYSYLR